MRLLRLVVIGGMAGWLWSQYKQKLAADAAERLGREPRPEPLQVWESEGGALPVGAQTDPQAAVH